MDPSQLFILADDPGWGDPSCYGNGKFRTPSLDRLAREGTLFTQYYQGVLSAYGFDEAHCVDAIADMMGESVNLWSVENRPRASKVLVEETLAVLDRVKDPPFYCELWLNDPHAPLAPSVEQMKPFRRSTPARFTSPLEVYAGTVAEMDRQIGRLLAKLDDLHLTENTLVIVSSDNGLGDIDIGNATWAGIGSAGPLRGHKTRRRLRCSAARRCGNLGRAVP
jgi:arylsulfatase A-like enzyme